MFLLDMIAFFDTATASWLQMAFLLSFPSFMRSKCITPLLTRRHAFLQIHLNNIF
ncbi:hypothetical protein HMP0721_0067 [Pseudoramibacter alactolyticus ATCC 23263]|uniref:Uncharacterized protein n=1 Tax=Pseudoramibacter alactolyticus ATCC 23263 TaxID=887929 RepID=E6MDI5_9FIRM|nr:hypothetical protein HMP0721_0067 [Pseudoramibacter alactolyticus ATCC 23263]